MEEQELNIRKAGEADIPSVINLFRDTILCVNARDYTPEQTLTWAAAGSNPEKWQQRIQVQYFLVAELEAELAGFASVSPSCYLDMLYVHKNFQRKGIASALWCNLKEFCKQQKISELYSDVSFTARPFFEKQGFEVEGAQKQSLDGVEFTNFRMHKKL